MVMVSSKPKCHQKMPLITAFRGAECELQSSNTNVFRTPGYGIWKHTTKRNFLASFTFFRFNADGTQAGRSDITEHIELGEDADEFTATLVNKTFGANGNLITTTCPTETGERLTFD